jgi:hypothetical protein
MSSLGGDTPTGADKFVKDLNPGLHDCRLVCYPKRGKQQDRLLDFFHRMKMVGTMYLDDILSVKLRRPWTNFNFFGFQTTLGIFQILS